MVITLGALVSGRSFSGSIKFRRAMSETGLADVAGAFRRWLLPLSRAGCFHRRARLSRLASSLAEPGETDVAVTSVRGLFPQRHELVLRLCDKVGGQADPLSCGAPTWLLAPHTKRPKAWEETRRCLRRASSFVVLKHTRWECKRQHLNV